jgi:hypothetical protein
MMADNQNKLAGDLNIDKTDLDEEIVKQPALYSYYAERQAEADQKVKDQKLALEVFEAALDRQIRDKALAKREKLTEQQVVMRMKNSDAWINHRKKVNELTAQADQIKGIVEAMRQKKDMLITISANARQELNSTGMKINKEIPIVKNE